MRIVLLGFGSIGQATAQLLSSQRDELARLHGLRPRLVGVADRRGAALDPAGLDPLPLLEAKRQRGTIAQLDLSPLQLLQQVEADVLVDATTAGKGDCEAAVERLRAGFKRGMHVVCVNKLPLATALPSLIEQARYNRVLLRYSGAVSGATPVLDLARRCAAADEVVGLRAALSGAANFACARVEAGASWAAAIEEGERLGHLPRGWSLAAAAAESAIKLVLIANALFQRPLALGDVAVAGPGASWPAGHRLLGELGEQATVGPGALPAGSPLKVAFAELAVTLRTRLGGDLTLTGPDGGGLQTATAILRDLIGLWHRTWDGSAR